MRFEGELPKKRMFAIVYVLGLALAAAPFIWLLSIYHTIPEQVPTHFSPSTPDAWGSKRSIWLLPTMGLLLYLGMASWTFFPKWKVPAQTTQEDAERVVLVTVAMLQTMAIALALSFLYITVQVVRIAVGESSSLGVWFLPLALVGTVGPLVVGLWAIYRRKMPAPA